MLEKKKKKKYYFIMACTNPLYGLRLGAINPKTGKERIKVLPRRIGDDYFSLCERHGKDSVVILPCGKCDSCIENRSKSWALRCVLEASEYEDNCFITLTYNDKCLPNGLCKKDFQSFIKRLRYYYPGLRYYACGEYGGKTHRPHYHAILFNCFPKDSKYLYTNSRGDNFFTSKVFSQCWPYGFISISDCTFESCAYVARYCSKKLCRNTGEFSLMSLKPGIGYQYFEDHKEKIYKYDLICGNFGRTNNMRPSRYFDKLFEKFNSEDMKIIKDIRINKSNITTISSCIDHGFQYYEQNLNYLADIKAEKFKKLKRKDI